MPTYEYECPGCGGRVEQTRGFNEDQAAPTCGDCILEMKRIYRAPNVTFKGVGFYSTDKNL